MATVRWHRPELTGATVKLFLKPKTSSTVANTGGDDMAESNGMFSATVGEDLTNWHFAEMRESPYALADVVATGWVNMSATSPIVVETIATESASGGGATAQADNDEPTAEPLELIVGELGRPRSVTCLNSDGTNRDLTQWGAKVFVIERPNKTADVQVVEDGDITISGADNHIFTFQPSAAVLAKKADYLWSLREVSTGYVIIEDRLSVSYSPLEDTP